MREKGFKYYLKGKKAVNKAFRKNFSLYFKYFIFLIINAFARMTVFFFPFVELSRNNLLSEILNNNNFKTSDIIEELNDNNKVKHISLFSVNLIRVLVISGGLAILYVLSIILYQFGLHVDTLLSYELVFEEILIVPLLFLIPTILTALIFTIILNIRFDLTVLLIHEKNYNAKEALKNTNKMFNRKTFSKIFSTYFFNIVEFILAVVLLVALTFLMDYLLGGYSYITFIFIFSIVIIFKIPKTIMSINISRMNIIKDLIVFFDNDDLYKKEELSESEQLVILFEENSEEI